MESIKMSDREMRDVLVAAQRLVAKEVATLGVLTISGLLGSLKTEFDLRLAEDDLFLRYSGIDPIGPSGKGEAR